MEIKIDKTMDKYQYLYNVYFTYKQLITNEDDTTCYNFIVDYYIAKNFYNFTDKDGVKGTKEHCNFIYNFLFNTFMFYFATIQRSANGKITYNKINYIDFIIYACNIKYEWFTTYENLLLNQYDDEYHMNEIIDLVIEYFSDLS